MKFNVTKTDRFGLVRPGVDAHTLGISSIEQILKACGFQTVVADATACTAFGEPDKAGNPGIIEKWIRGNRITILGFSYRLDPREGAAVFARLVHQIRSKHLLREEGGPLNALFFAGLPRTCELVRSRNAEVSAVFEGDETPMETLHLLGVSAGLIPLVLTEGSMYDETRLALAKDLIQKEKHLGLEPVDRGGYPEFGTKRDTLIARIEHGIKHRLPPLMRAHAGPFLPDRIEAVKLFHHWARQLAASGLLDVLSIGTSQLTQSEFGEYWGDKPNGGGVPLNSPEEFASVWQAARPMLIRTYAGTRNIPEMARMHEQTINIAWHALSFWWFCQIDGRGPNAVKENLRQHIEALKYIASTTKPFEANIPHHFAFRGADDVTCVVSAVIAARTAKRLGIRHFILQTMLNTPKYIWGIQDLAKSRAMLHLARELEDEHFHVILQPRAGLDYFSSELDKAKVQLAAVSMMMDDIEPDCPASPPVIHVVSYSEASHLADPPVINESIQITRHAIEQYRELRAQGNVDDMTNHPEVVARTEDLIAGARMVIHAIESSIPEPYTPEGLYLILAKGFLPVPYLWECKEEFKHALRWSTRIIDGSVKVVDQSGKPIETADRIRTIMSS